MESLLRRSRCCDGAAQTSSVALILRVASTTELMLLRRSCYGVAAATELRRLARDHGLKFNQALQVFNHWEWLNTCYRYRCSTMVEHHTVQPLFNHCSTTVQPFNHCSTQ